MEQACLAKFTQDEAACAALRATGEREITHVLPQDSKNIPGVVMAAIWMRVRARLRQGPQRSRSRQPIGSSRSAARRHVRASPRWLLRLPGR